MRAILVFLVYIYEPVANLLVYKRNSFNFSDHMTFSFAVLLVVSAVQMFGGYWRIKLLIHLSNHHWRPLHKQQKDHDALCLLPGHPTRKVSPKFE